MTLKWTMIFILFRCLFPSLHSLLFLRVFKRPVYVAQGESLFNIFSWFSVRPTMLAKLALSSLLVLDLIKSLFWRAQTVKMYIFILYFYITIFYMNLPCALLIWRHFSVDCYSLVVGKLFCILYHFGALFPFTILGCF